MIRKIFLIVLLIFSCFSFLSVDAISFPSIFSSSSSSSGGAPEINCAGLPGCGGIDIAKVSTSNNKAVGVIAKIIGEMIKYVAVLAVIALMIAGVMYLVSGGEEERTKKAKRWIIWALLGVVVSVSAWFVVNLINNLSIY